VLLHPWRYIRRSNSHIRRSGPLLVAPHTPLFPFRAPALAGVSGRDGHSARRAVDRCTVDRLCRAGRTRLPCVQVVRCRISGHTDQEHYGRIRSAGSGVDRMPRLAAADRPL
jgi:hypothetical protein